MLFGVFSPREMASYVYQPICTMKAFAFAIALVLAAGALQAVCGHHPEERSGFGFTLCPARDPARDQDAGGIVPSGQPKVQMERIWEEIEAYQALKRVPNIRLNAKRRRNIVSLHQNSFYLPSALLGLARPAGKFACLGDPATEREFRSPESYSDSRFRATSCRRRIVENLLLLDGSGRASMPSS